MFENLGVQANDKAGRKFRWLCKRCSDERNKTRFTLILADVFRANVGRIASNVTRNNALFERLKRMK